MKQIAKAVLGALAAALVAKGVVGPEAADQWVSSTTEIIVGLAPFVVAGALSLYKKFAKKSEAPAGE